MCHNIFNKIININIEELLNYGRNFKKQKSSQLVKYGSDNIIVVDPNNINENLFVDKETFKKIINDEKQIYKIDNFLNNFKEKLNDIEYIYFLNIKYKPSSKNILENVNYEILNKYLSKEEIEKVNKIKNIYNNSKYKTKLLKQNIIIMMGKILFIFSIGSENIEIIIKNNLKEGFLKNIFAKNNIMYGFKLLQIEDRNITKISEIEFLQYLKENNYLELL